MAQSVTIKKRKDHPLLVLFTKDRMYAENPITWGLLPPLRFLGGPTNKGMTGNMHESWYINRLVVVATEVGVSVEEALEDIRMNNRKETINLECDCEAIWTKSLVD